MHVHGYTLHDVVYADDTAWIWRSVRRRDSTPALLKVAAAGGGDRRAAARLRDEFALGRLIAHPAVLRYLELIDDGDVVAIVHEPFESRPLSACIPAGGMDLPQFIEIAVQLAEGLGAIHAHRVLHRNITPARVLYDEGTRRLKYADLSAAEPVTSAAPAEHRRPLTYAPPEESGRVSHPIDFRSDLYALGATFFHLLAGGPPFATHDPLQLIHHHLAKPPVFPPSIRPAVPEAVAFRRTSTSCIAGLITGDYEEAYEYGRVGIALAERYGNRSIQSWCCFLFGCGTLIWRAPLREGRTYLEQSVRLGVESGNLASASYAASYIITDTFFSGAHLDDVRALHDEYSPFLQRSNPAIHLFCELGTQSVRELLGLHRLDDAAFLRDFGGSAISDGPGRGTSFEIRLPAHAQAAVRRGHTPKRVVRAAARCILIVDDNRSALGLR